MPLTLDGTNGEVFPSWTTATRPASPGAGQTGFNTTTGQLETYNGSGWRISTAASTQGTSGQYLQSAGAGAAPTWATLSSSGSLIRAPQILTSGTSYTTPSNCTAIYVEMIGGGGGGGGAAASNACSGGGGGGAYGTIYSTVTSSTAYTIAIGAAGSAGAGGGSPTSGGAGGTTSITIGATTYSAGGGAGGSGAAASSSGAGGSYGTTTNCTIWSFTGTSGESGLTANYGGAGGQPGGIYLPRFAARQTSGNSAGNAATGYGCGGGGAFAGNLSGGVGYQGLMRIWEFT